MASRAAESYWGGWMATPMMVQYRRIKHRYRNEVLFFRMGDFYEMFEQDAREVSALLDITLTKRNGIPMCGIPYHAAQGYIVRLLKAGKKIAICEQTQLPKSGRGLAKREVVEVITPGTVVDEGLLDQNANNYLAALGRQGNDISFSYIDLSTAQFYTTSFPFSERIEELKRELYRLSPSEIIVQDSLLEDDESLVRLLDEKEGLVVNRYPDWSFDPEASREELKGQLGVQNLKAFGLTENAPEITSAGVILEYIRQTAKRLLPHLKTIVRYRDSSYVGLDESTQRNLEIFHNLQDGGRRYTLIEVLDFCKSSMGARKLKRWILAPLLDKAAIQSRLDAVEFFYRNQILLSSLREQMAKTLDLERLSAKVALDRANAKDLLSIKTTLGCIQSIHGMLADYPKMSSFCNSIAASAPDLKELESLIERSITEDPSVQLNEGNLIKAGYDKELDSLRKVKSDARKMLDRLLQGEVEKTGITSLKLRFNRIIGYFFEVTKANQSLVPDYFLRRQSLVGGERYTTTELSELEVEINSAAQKVSDLERQLFLEVRDKVKEGVSAFLHMADLISELDVLQSFAFAATIHGYAKPKLRSTRDIHLVEGRHPVVEAHLPPGAFVPNSLHLRENEDFFILLTGPNMAGKSTYLRQVALIVLMAQIGSFVPAQDAQIGLVDKIFCRVGAMDNLARGESTFLVEMNETAHILRNATDRSLLILDEVGRGTGTRDGLSIAWAVINYILKEIKAKTLFATHYHELTTLKAASLRNMTMEVIEKNGEIVFLKKVKKGSSDNSYGIHVAKLAGIPGDVINEAEQILRGLPSESLPAKTDQPTLFPSDSLVIDELRSMDITNITPLQAINLLAKWKDTLEQPPE